MNQKVIPQKERIQTLDTEVRKNVQKANVWSGIDVHMQTAR